MLIEIYMEKREMGVHSPRFSCILLYFVYAEVVYIVLKILFILTARHKTKRDL